MSFRDFLRLLKRNLWVLLTASLLAAAVAFYLMRDERVQYTSHATVYTGILSGYNLSGDARIDLNQVNGRFDNIIGNIEARETIENVAVQLLAHYLVFPDSVRERLNSRTHQDLSSALPVSVQRQLIAPSPQNPTLDATVRRVRSMVQANQSQQLHELIYELDTSPFSISGIQDDMQASRVRRSDLIEVQYGSYDPFLTKLTLDILLDTFIRRYESLRQNQVNSVVSYFERKVQEAADALRSNVEDLRRYRTQEGIVNYAEQTEALALEREDAASLLQQERSRLRAARNALQTLEQRLSINSEILRRNEEILNIREQLSALSAQAAIQSTRSERPAARVERQMDSLRTALRARIQEVYRLNSSTEGIQRENVLNEWLSKVIQVTEQRARVRTFEERMTEYRQRYRDLAPKGATLSNLEREVSISENEYLDLLRSLNDARAKRQNVQMTTNLNVVDPPYIPQDFTQSNRTIVVSVAGAGTFFLLLGLMILARVLDNSIQKPERAEEATGLHMATAYPVLHEVESSSRSRDSILGVLDMQLFRAVQLSLMSSAESTQFITNRRAEVTDPNDADPSSMSSMAVPTRLNPPPLILVVSTQPAEGKSFVAERLSSVTAHRESPTLYLAPHTASPPTENVKVANYPSTAGDDMYNEIADLISTSAASEVEYVIMELPPLTRESLPINLIQRAGAVVVVAHADRTWARTDAEALDALRVSTETEPALVLNGVDMDYIDNITGMTPNHRSGFTQRVSDIFKYGISSRKFPHSINSRN